MNETAFFNVSGMVGEPVYARDTGRFAGYVGADDLLAEMDRCGVAESLVCHWEAMKCHPGTGNERLGRQISGQPRLHPCWVVLPHHTGESPAPGALLAQMRSQGVRAVRLQPHLFGFSVAGWSVGELLDALEAEGVLTIIEAAAEELQPICERHPGLKLVATDTNLRSLYPLLGRYPNLHLSMEGASHPDMLEDVCQRFGADRILFGSPHVPPVFPTGAIRTEPGFWGMGPAVATVSYARISPQERLQIAGGNLRRLLGREAVTVAAPEPAGAIAGAAWRGQPLPGRIVDSHFHLGPWAYTCHPGTGLGAALAMMDAAGIERLCLSSTRAVTGGDHYEGNREIALACRQHPDRFVGIGVINPHFPDTEDEIRRCLEDFGFRGLKVHPRIHQCDLGDPKYEPVWRASESHGVPVQAHTGEHQTGASPRAFAAIASCYPAGIFHLNHSGDNVEGLRLCLDLAERYPNLYLGTSDVAFMYAGMLEYAVRRVGAHRIVFESDCSAINFNHSLGIVAFADISEEEKALILGGNMARLLAL